MRHHPDQRLKPAKGSVEAVQESEPQGTPSGVKSED